MPPATDVPSHQRKHYTVLVTGFGPFRVEYPINPAWEIARALGKALPLRSELHMIHVICPDAPIKTAYASTREIVPKLLSKHHAQIDMVLHLGMLSTRDDFALETLAHRGEYSRPDVDGSIPPLDEPESLFGDCPTLLRPSLDVQAVFGSVRRVIQQADRRTSLFGLDIRLSQDAGRFLCEYTLYNSLVWYARRTGDVGLNQSSLSTSRPVMFLHVPRSSDETALEQGVAVASSVIQAMADTYPT